MITVQQQLQSAINAAIESIDISGVATSALQVVPCGNPQFGDYQWNGALPLAKATKQNPRNLAQSIVDNLCIEGICKTPEIAGPGFINFRLESSFLNSALLQAFIDPRLGIPSVELPRTIIVDYPSPNVAKPLHVGHIRTMFIGDAITRILRFAGHNVVTDNHVGDWGTPIGKVIYGWKQQGDEAAFAAGPLVEMGRLYKLVNDLAESDPEIMGEVRRETALLQAGDESNRAIWEKLRAASQTDLDALYERLDIHPDVTLGESFYQDMLPGVVEDLRGRGLAIESQGALIVCFDEPSLADHPMLVQKSDGAALYATTDLATIKYRMERWKPDEIIYVVDARQSTHFQQVFATARKWGYDSVTLRHVTFGAILGDDGKPIKTRSGESIKLNDLLDESELRALSILREKNSDLSGEQSVAIARAIGIGSIKYADLAPNRTSDYVFSWDKMLAMNGNTAPYLLNAYVRIQSIFRRAAADGYNMDPPQELTLEHDAEQRLAKYLLQYGMALECALIDYRVNALTDYLFELAHKFHTFYEKCPVMQSDEPYRSSRFVVCRFTSDVLKHGLGLLGITVIDQM